MRPKKKPLTTSGWIHLQADEIIQAIDIVLAKNNIDESSFTLQIAANVVRTICDITIVSANGKSFTTTSTIIDKFSPFDNEAYWSKTEKVLMAKYKFRTVKKVPNVRKYEFCR